MTEGSEFESWYSHEFSLVHIVRIGSGTYPALYPARPGCSFPGIKWPGRKARHQLVPSPPTHVFVVLSYAQRQLYLFQSDYET
jgi:hypothetical protein